MPEYGDASESIQISFVIACIEEAFQVISFVNTTHRIVNAIRFVAGKTSSNCERTLTNEPSRVRAHSSFNCSLSFVNSRKTPVQVFLLLSYAFDLDLPQTLEIGITSNCISTFGPV
jgi:hypothetical protein